jgi:TolB protein
MLRKINLLFLSIGICLFSAQASAMLDLELTQGVDSALPIAVLPFLGQESIANDDSNTYLVVSKDLRNSGRFNLADVSNLLPNLGKGGINYDYWQQRKVEDVVTGQVEKTGGSQYRISFQLIDVYNKATLLQRQYNVNATQLRVLAHHIGDLIYQKLTGDRGVFSTKIAYVLLQRKSAAQARYSLQVADYDGYSPQNLVTSDQPLMSPAWSRDGKRLAYVSFEGARATIYVQDIASGRRQVVSKQPGINGAPAWSPDGSKLAVVLSTTGYPKIYILNLNGGSLEQMTSDWYIDTEPCWSPDGKSLLFTSNRSGGPQIYRLYLDSKKLERLTYQGSYNARASFTGDGKGIVMLHKEDGPFSIAVQDLSSGKVKVLSVSDFNESPSVAPNGKMVIYGTNYNNRGILAEVSADAKVKISLPAQEGEVQEPTWSPFLDNADS